MVRVKVRLSNKDAVGKIVRFEEHLDFNCLLYRIASKLRVAPTPDTAASSASNRFNLYLNGNVEIEDTDEINEDDDLVLKLKPAPVRVKMEDIEEPVLENKVYELSDSDNGGADGGNDDFLIRLETAQVGGGGMNNNNREVVNKQYMDRKVISPDKSDRKIDEDLVDTDENSGDSDGESDGHKDQEKIGAESNNIRKRSFNLMFATTPKGPEINNYVEKTWLLEKDEAINGERNEKTPTCAASSLLSKYDLSPQALISTRPSYYDNDIPRNEETPTCAASSPLSKYDLSPQALVSTRPSYYDNDIPPLPSAKGLLTILNVNQVRSFIVSSRKILYEQNSYPYMQEMPEYIPEFARFDSSVRNLYRNFIDSEDPLIGRSDALGYSRREMDIVLYALSKEIMYSKCQRILLPYRKPTAVRSIFAIVKSLRYHENEKYLSYMNHVKKCVGRILLSEENGSTYNATSLRKR